MSAPTLCPECRLPTWQSVEHHCGRNEYRVIVRRDGAPAYQAGFTESPAEVPALLRHVRREYQREVGAVVVAQRRWVDGWSDAEFEPERGREGED